VPGGVAVLPLDSPLFPRLAAAAAAHAVLTFGADTAADMRLLALEGDAEGSHLRLSLRGRDAVLRLHAPGRHMAMNALAALAGVAALGLDPVRAVPALEAFRPVAGRGMRRALTVRGAPVLLLDESYNGNGASMRAALDVLRLQPAARRIAVLGDMLELGEAGPAEHAALADSVAASADLVFTCGPLMRHLFDALPEALRGAHEPDSTQLASLIAQVVDGGDAVLVKGSLGSRMKRVVDAILAAAAPAAAYAAGPADGKTD
jgi:UDP-N-acetylmuramoyl-tripeptide--D-alanyl-D-alanine ligase